MMLHDQTYSIMSERKEMHQTNVKRLSNFMRDIARMVRGDEGVNEASESVVGGARERE
jgi:hypothetical protein